MSISSLVSSAYVNGLTESGISLITPFSGNQPRYGSTNNTFTALTCLKILVVYVSISFICYSVMYVVYTPLHTYNLY